MPIVTVGPHELFNDWPNKYEDTPAQIRELLVAVQNFTEATLKRKVKEAQALLPALSDCLNNAHKALTGSSGTELSKCSYAIWLDSDSIRPAIDTLGEFIKVHDRRHQEGIVARHHVPLQYTLAAWAKLFGSLMQLQYILEGRAAPYLLDKAEQSAV